MSKAEILAELPKLSPEELAEIQSRIEDLAVYGADGWRTNSGLTEGDKHLLGERIADLDQHPEKSIPWGDAEARLKQRFGP